MRHSSGEHLPYMRIICDIRPDVGPPALNFFYMLRTKVKNVFIGYEREKLVWATVLPSVRAEENEEERIIF